MFKSGVGSFFVLGCRSIRPGREEINLFLVVGWCCLTTKHELELTAFSSSRRPFDFKQITLVLATHSHDNIITHHSVESVAIILPSKR